MGYYNSCNTPFLALLSNLPKGTSISALNFDASFFGPGSNIIFQGLTTSSGGPIAAFTVTVGGVTFNISVPVRNIIALGV